MAKFPFPNVKRFEFLKNGIVKITSVIDSRTGETERRNLHDMDCFLRNLCHPSDFKGLSIKDKKQLLKEILLEDKFDDLEVIIQ